MNWQLSCRWSLGFHIVSLELRSRSLLPNIEKTFPAQELELGMTSFNKTWYVGSLHLVVGSLGLSSRSLLSNIEKNRFHSTA